MQPAHLGFEHEAGHNPYPQAQRFARFAPELHEGQGQRLFDEEKALRAWLAERAPDADDYVFNSQKSTQMHRVTVNKLFKAIAKAAGLPEMLQHPHCLKHTCAMLLVDRV